MTVAGSNHKKYNETLTTSHTIFVSHTNSNETLKKLPQKLTSSICILVILDKSK